MNYSRKLWNKQLICERRPDINDILIVSVLPERKANV